MIDPDMSSTSHISRRRYACLRCSVHFCDFNEADRHYYVDPRHADCRLLLDTLGPAGRARVVASVVDIVFVGSPEETAEGQADALENLRTVEEHRIFRDQAAWQGRREEQPVHTPPVSLHGYILPPLMCRYTLGDEKTFPNRRRNRVWVEEAHTQARTLPACDPCPVRRGYAHLDLLKYAASAHCEVIRSAHDSDYANDPGLAHRPESAES